MTLFKASIRIYSLPAQGQDNPHPIRVGVIFVQFLERNRREQRQIDGGKNTSKFSTVRVDQGHLVLNFRR